VPSSTSSTLDYSKSNVTATENSKYLTSVLQHLPDTLSHHPATLHFLPGTLQLHLPTFPALPLLLPGIRCSVLLLLSTVQCRLNTVRNLLDTLLFLPLSAPCHLITRTFLVITSVEATDSSFFFTARLPPRSLQLHLVILLALFLSPIQPIHSPSICFLPLGASSQCPILPLRSQLLTHSTHGRSFQALTVPGSSHSVPILSRLAPPLRLFPRSSKFPLVLLPLSVAHNHIKSIEISQHSPSHPPLSSPISHAIESRASRNVPGIGGTMPL